MKTHKVIDLFKGESGVFVGTIVECLNWKIKQGYGYKIMRLIKEEREIENK